MLPYTTIELIAETIRREIDASASRSRIYPTKPSGCVQQLRWRTASRRSALR